MRQDETPFLLAYSIAIFWLSIALVLELQPPWCCWHKGTNPNQNLPLCYLHLVAAAPTSAQDGLDLLQLTLVVFLLSSTGANTSLALMVVITCNWHCMVVLFFYAN